MGHFVTGFIVKESCIENVLPIVPFKCFHRMSQGFVIFPLTDDLIDQYIAAPQTYTIREFTYLSEKLFNILVKVSNVTPVVYLETEYHGGQGAQTAIAIVEGVMIYGPKKSESGPIREALRIIGVIKEPGHYDEFQSVGLGGFRSSEELLEGE